MEIGNLQLKIRTLNEQNQELTNKIKSIHMRIDHLSSVQNKFVKTWMGLKEWVSEDIKSTLDNYAKEQVNENFQKWGKRGFMIGLKPLLNDYQKVMNHQMGIIGLTKKPVVWDYRHP
jgi:uncharacterized membrane-anchored protein YjiN (DUF445 family)